MVQARNHDLIARFQDAANGSTQMKSEGRHIGPEDNFPGGRGIEEIGHSGAGFVDNRIVAATGDEMATVICIGTPEIVGHGINHSLRYLSPAGPIEVYVWLTLFICFLQGREMFSQGRKVYGFFTHHKRLLTNKRFAEW